MFYQLTIDESRTERIAERIQYYGPNGKLITKSLKDYARKAVNNEFESLDQFLQSWTDAGQKKFIIEELEKQGVLFEALAEDGGKNGYESAVTELKQHIYE